ncbi:TrkH family potassium uptake protein [Albimonas sp. CAU 1670]|uniref:TrkH family potassium uptake protein n=1 Tax=Albimonas sp. CAU 1670 TaxID=3032599 RepID=UPI0023DBB379|nr:TrkH family potassium uptake protein [Albimonas sp. CAU 1670]MDF2232852.1 TrkH family potassium uptake protein [Albimonas sp. CAU 1670]
MQLVLFTNGVIFALMGVLMLAPAAVDGRLDGPFVEAAFLTVAVGALVAAAARGGRPGFRPRHAFAMTTTAWITAAAAGAMPMLVGGISFTDAYFESMSGLTTTGSTVLSGLDAQPRGLLAWRSILQWLGGVGIIVMGIAVLPALRVGGMQLYRSESSDKAEKEFASAGRFATGTAFVYLLLTLACMMAYELCGMGDFEALMHAMTTVSTGGFSTHDASLGHYNDTPAIQWVAVVFMLSGSLPFIWYLRGWTRRTFDSEQVRIYVGSLAVIILAVAAWLAVERAEAPLDALRLSAFNVVSLVTTTGFANTDYMLWGPAPMALFLIITCFGGCTGSTSGGLKSMRIIIATKALFAAVRRVHSPHSVQTVRFEGRPVDDATLSSVMAFCVFFLMTFLVLAMALGLLGLDIDTAVSGAATALANVGPGIGDVIGPAGSFASLPDSAKWLLSLGMLLGRLEVMTVLVLLQAHRA